MIERGAWGWVKVVSHVKRYSLETRIGIVDPAGIRSLLCHLSPGPEDPELIKVNPSGSVYENKFLVPISSESCGFSC